MEGWSDRPPNRKPRTTHILYIDNGRAPHRWPDIVRREGPSVCNHICKAPHARTYVRVYVIMSPRYFAIAAAVNTHARTELSNDLLFLPTNRFLIFSPVCSSRHSLFLLETLSWTAGRIRIFHQFFFPSYRVAFSVFAAYRSPPLHRNRFYF